MNSNCSGLLYVLDDFPYLYPRIDGNVKKKQRKIKENPTRQYNLEKTLNLLVFRKIQIKMMIDTIIYP